MDEQKTPSEDNESSLESTDTSVVSSDSPTTGSTSPTSPAKTPETTPSGVPTPKLPPRHSLRFKSFLNRFNVYLLAFVLVIMIAGIAIVVSIRLNKRNNTTTQDLLSKSLSPEELSQLRTSDTSVGDPKQTLTIASNTVINGRVLLRSDLDVAGTIKVGSALNLPGITVAGTSTFDQIQAKHLNIDGDSTLQGALNVQRNLTVTGSASFGGAISAPQIAIQTLQLNGDLQLNRHIDAGGGTPGKSDGTALGNGGTTSISGTDTAGTVTINIGSSPAAGCFITVNFAQKFNGTPHVVVTPIGSGAAGLNYYLNRSSTSFSICSTNAASSGSSFSFDYVAID